VNPQWYVLLRAARDRLGLSRKQLAARAVVSEHTVKSYELGDRGSRPYLTAILDALKVERGERNRILTGAGYAPDGLDIRPHGDINFTRDEAAAEVDRYAWPAFVVDEYMELVAANVVILRLWDVDLATEFREPGELNLLTAATNPRFADRCLSWDETVGAMAGVFKYHHRGPESTEDPSPVFAQVLRHVMKYDQQYIARLGTLWERAEPTPNKLRWSYPVVWKDPRCGGLVMRFTAFASSANEPDGLGFNDWIPLDGETWAALEKLASGAM
jgi:transcriptional regulator with XRE-family HTH domain